MNTPAYTRVKVVYDKPAYTRVENLDNWKVYAGLYKNQKVNNILSHRSVNKTGFI